MSKIKWNNLFLDVSSYHIKIMHSRYRICFFYIIFITAVTFLFINLSPFRLSKTYLIALVLLILSLLFIGVFTSSQSRNKVLCAFVITSDGIISFVTTKASYQLLATSRFSFLGFWLVMEPLNVNNNTLGDARLVNLKKTKYFIYRDSLNGQDFARLINVVNALC